MNTDFLNALHCWSLSAKEGDPAPLRERASLKQQQRAENLRLWHQALAEEEGLFYLATCHRIELYGWTSSPDALIEKWIEASSKTSAQGLEMKASLSHHQGEAALAHLIRVCSGLESEVLGETQILGQVKDAVRESRDLALLTGPIDRATQMAFRVAKKIRTNTRIGEGTVSIAHAAVDGLSDVFEDFSDKKIAIVGAGTMALQAMEKFWNLGVRRISWINRSLEKIQNHAWAERVSCYSLESLAAEVSTSHVTVLATRAEEPILTRSVLGAVATKSKLGPQIILDLGLPRNASEDVHRLAHYIVRNVDEFSDRSLKGHHQRAQAVPVAMQLLQDEMKICLKDWNHYSSAPARRELMQAIAEVKAHTLADLKLESNPDLEYVIHSIYGKLSHHLLQELEQVQDEDLSGRVLEVITRAWRRPQTNGSQEEIPQQLAQIGQESSHKARQARSSR
ncbi:MAG TPA: glutamyl-tRNA reductase [Bdellovibrionota bacterium]|nr:glutamyl-tRNA reductase [Bdellovibrionota bacterium]